MKRLWWLSYLIGGVLAALPFAIFYLPFVFSNLPGSGFYWFPLVSLLSALIGTGAQFYFLKYRLGASLTSTWLWSRRLSWLIGQGLAWALISSYVGFSLIFLIAPTPINPLFFLLIHGIFGGLVGFVVGGIQAILWRSHLQPWRWLGLSVLAWGANAGLYGFCLVAIGGSWNYPWLWSGLIILGGSLGWGILGAIIALVILPTLVQE